MIGFVLLPFRFFGQHELDSLLPFFTLRSLSSHCLLIFLRLKENVFYFVFCFCFDELFFLLFYRLTEAYRSCLYQRVTTTPWSFTKKGLFATTK